MRYSKIDRRIWSDEKFASLSGPAKLLVFYLLTSPHTVPLPGVIRISEQGVAADLGWPVEQCSQRFSELYGIGFVKYYSQYSPHMYMPNGIRYNFPPNVNVIKGWEKYFWELPEPLKSDVMQAFRAAIEASRPEWISAFDTVSKPFGNPCRLHEHEHEHKHEQYCEPYTVSVQTAFDAKAGADWLCEQLAVAGKPMRSLLAEVIEQERRNGVDEVQPIAENMLRTRRNYEAQANTGFVWPVKAFFEQGVWKRPNEWKAKANGKRTIADAVQSFDAADV